MMIQGVSISEMINQSVNVLTKPSVQSFEQYERRGGMREAFTYVGIAAVIAGIVAALVGAVTDTSVVGAFIGALLGVIISYAIFAFLIYFIGKQLFHGTGTQSEVFYTTALYSAPIQAISAVLNIIPGLGFIVGIVLGIYQIYLGYLAARSSMNLNQTNAIITLLIAFLVPFILVSIVLGVIIAALVGVSAATS